MEKGNCERCGNICEECICENGTTYLCSWCLESFLSNKYFNDWCCLECEKDLEIIPRIKINDPDIVEDLFECNNIVSGYICRYCAFRFNATPPYNQNGDWYRSICDFCGEEKNVSHTSNWHWPDINFLEDDADF